MPIGNITQTISTLPPAGRRGVDVQTQFVIKQEDFQDHLQGITVGELNTLKDQLNTRIGEINSTTTTMNGYAGTASAGASTATTKAGEASASASEALTSRNQAETFKNNANTSASTATTKASEASASALSANTSASEALTSRNQAETFKNNANTSASTATTKASIATTKAGEASTSASTASAGASTATTKAGEASTSASDALAYKNQAETFKNNASASATKASQWADNNYNVEVETGKYSAKHWSTVSQNATANKVDKVASTDNAVVRFDGTTGNLQNSAITIDDVGNIGSGTQSFNGLGGTGFKNYIINGGFDIWQRGTSFSLSGLTYTADRFIVGHTTGGTATKVEGLNGFGNAIQINGSSSGNAILAQRIEASNSATLGRNNSGYATLSFYAKANGAGQPIHINISIPTVSDNYAGSNIVKSIQIGVTSTGWTKYIYTFPLDFVYWGGFHLEMTGLNVTTFAVCGVQLEGGSVATPFEQRPIGLELSLCKRYYETSGNARIEEFRNTTTGSIQYGAVRFMVEKRSTPTLVVLNDTTMEAGTVGQDNGTPVSFSISSPGNTGFRLQWTNTAGRFGASFHYTASAEL